jgi:hypothetical protein
MSIQVDIEDAFYKIMSDHGLHPDDLKIVCTYEWYRELEDQLLINKRFLFTLSNGDEYKDDEGNLQKIDYPKTIEYLGMPLEICNQMSARFVIMRRDK